MDLNSFQKGGFWDDAKGGWLDDKLVKAAREEEMGYVRKHVIYMRVPRSMCYTETEKAPIKTGWADTNKGTAADPNIRCRWVAKEFNAGPRPDLYAGTSPIEGVRSVVSQVASTGRRDTVLTIIDVRRAYFYAAAQRRVFVELPPEDYQPDDENMCGLLCASLYGTRDAAQRWGASCEERTTKLEFTVAVYAVCGYYHPQWKLHVLDMTMNYGNETTT